MAHNALATVQLDSVRRRPRDRYRVTIRAWSHTHDHPDPARRSAIVRGVYVSTLANAGGYTADNISITDRYSVDHTDLFTQVSGADYFGFDGYRELDTAKPCRPGFPSVLWSAYTGIYDDECLNDAACDAMRLQTFHIPSSPQLSVFNYLRGPLTFRFDITLPAEPMGVRIRVGLIGGNGGNPAQRGPIGLPDDIFVIQF